MSTHATSRAWAPRSNESRRLPFGPSPLLRADRLRRAASRHNRATLTGSACEYSPLLSPQKLSDARSDRGGALGDVFVQMLADPTHAMHTAMTVLGVARSLVSECDKRPLHVVLCEEQRPDGREDDAQVDLLADENPETLRAYIERADEAMAALQVARDRAAKRLEEMERGH